ncbi:hypothetical protein [Frankia gtarii]|uniref:hypothetical protein n=1 Tax=Frankia gtarii TaxID=2950102 RepID=UPI0021BFCBE7|nr:hypothetical protein [Frankia gtarii]
MTQIRSLWTTPIWTGTIPPDAVPAAQAEPDGQPRTVPPAIRDLEQLAARTIVRTAPEELRWEHRTECWSHPHHVGMRYADGDVRFFVILTAHGTTTSDPDGALYLHDPRPAALNISLPGLPWGRPRVLPALTRAAIIMPGWLGWSILPLTPAQQIQVWTGTGYHTRTATTSDDRRRNFRPHPSPGESGGVAG